MYYRLFDDSGGASPNLQQLFNPDIVKLSATSVRVTISMLGVTGTPTSYIVKYQRMLNDTTTTGSELTQTSATNGVTLTGLVENGLYRITTQLTNATTTGNKVEFLYKLSSIEEDPYKIGNQKNVGDKITAKSFLTITGGEQRDNEYTYAYRTFDSIQLPASTNQSIGEGAFNRTVKNYSVGYYSFGTSIIFEPLIKYKPQGAAIGFFFDQDKTSGYFVSLETSATAAAANTSPVKIFKLENKQIKKLVDSQKGNRATLDQLFAGTVYNVDVKVKVENKTITITAYVNGFKIEASDTTSASAKNEILEPTKKVALVGISGTSMFDYVYADTINATNYDKDYQTLNFYNGQFSGDFLDLAYGDMLYNASNQDVDMQSKQNAFDEFGTVVREMARKKVTFSSAPAVPIRWTTGANKLVNILGQNSDNFKSDVLVLNNSSITVPLSDKGVNQLSIFGNTIGFSGEIEYSTSPASEYSTAEPVIFESAWLQNVKDVESLAQWIKGRVVNKSKIVNMSIFGNPLISVGDIITIDYSYQGFTSSQKLIVVRANQRYQGGLETDIVARTL